MLITKGLKPKNSTLANSCNLRKMIERDNENDSFTRVKGFTSPN